MTGFKKRVYAAACAAVLLLPFVISGCADSLSYGTEDNTFPERKLPATRQMSDEIEGLVGLCDTVYGTTNLILSKYSASEVADVYGKIRALASTEDDHYPGFLGEIVRNLYPDCIEGDVIHPAKAIQRMKKFKEAYDALDDIAQRANDAFRVFRKQFDASEHETVSAFGEYLDAALEYADSVVYRNGASESYLAELTRLRQNLASAKEKAKGFIN